MAIPNIRSNGGNNALNSLQHHLGSAGEEEEEDEEDEEEEEEEEEGPVEPHLQQQHLQGCHDPVYSDFRLRSRTLSMFYKRHPIRDIVLILERLRDRL